MNIIPHSFNTSVSENTSYMLLISCIINNFKIFIMFDVSAIGNLSVLVKVSDVFLFWIQMDFLQLS